MAVHQKRISSAIVDAPEEGLDDGLEESDSKSLKKSIETQTKSPEPIVVTKPLKAIDDEQDSSGSTNSDLRDVLNCIRDPGDIKHLCHITCPRLRKEECKIYRTCPSDEEYEGEIPYDIDYEDYDLQGAKPVRIPLVHVKGCVHEMESQGELTREYLEPCKWCYCEDEGTSDEEAHYDDQLNDSFRDSKDVGFLKLLPPKLAAKNETGLVNLRNLPQDSDLQDILNCLLPPKAVTVNGEVWIQEVSPEPARRSDVIKLVELLEMKIEEQQTRKSGIDPVRSSLYEQLFAKCLAVLHLGRNAHVVAGAQGMPTSLSIQLLSQLQDWGDQWEVGVTRRSFHAPSSWFYVLWVSGAYVMSGEVQEAALALQELKNVDELIREETIVSPEAGLLLLRMRDEMKMTIAAWESILNQANNFDLQQISKCGIRLKPLHKELDKLTHEVEMAEQELAEFWAEQYLIKSEEHKKRDYVREDRKTELATHQARHKLLKEQIRLLVNREEDNTTHQSHLS